VGWAEECEHDGTMQGGMKGCLQPMMTRVQNREPARLPQNVRNQCSKAFCQDRRPRRTATVVYMNDAVQRSTPVRVTIVMP
jgi:hypothetical protein